MMIHEKLMSGQFLFDLKNDRGAELLHAAAHSHQTHAALQHLHHHPSSTNALPPSPPMPAAKMDLYSAYAYQQQLQQQLIGSSQFGSRLSPASHSVHRHQSAPAANEVLDLSRRFGPMETPPRKTPSPYQNSSFDSGSPVMSPTSTQPTLTHTLIPANLLYSMQAQQETTSALAIPDTLATLYPGLYYPGMHMKQEAAHSVTPPLLQAIEPSAQSRQQISPRARRNVDSVSLANTSTGNLLETFASAAAIAASVSRQSESRATDTMQAPAQLPVASKAALPTTPTSSDPPAHEAKVTRPFKTFPRDPLVIAANFAANDVLHDNPRVERYTEYRKRVLEQIRHSNGGSRTVTNPKMRRLNSRSGSINDGCSSSTNNSENEEQRSNAAEESSDCDSNAGNFDKMTSSTTSTTSTTSNHNNENINATAASAASSSGLHGHQHKDAAYYERRRKNNAAAKKSRDRRRIKEDEIAIRAAYLERQNIELLCQIDSLKAQLATFVAKVGA